MNAATFSECNNYRYWLERVINPYPLDGGRRLVWIMLNPSTADCTINDPTIKRCMGFTADWGYDSMEVVNLFAWRATDPRMLRKPGDPIGPLNDYHIMRATGNAALTVCAWGAHAMAKPRAYNVARVIGTLFPLHCLGVTASGMPLHPLYQPKTARPTPWRFPT